MLMVSEKLESILSKVQENRYRRSWYSTDRENVCVSRLQPLLEDLPILYWAGLTGRTTREIAFAAYLGLLLIAGAGTAFANGTEPGGLVAFDIPAQPLAAALNAYGAATGTEVFYKAALAVGRRSTAVKGTLSPHDALTILLSGTGYVSEATQGGMISIVAAPPEPASLADPPAINIGMFRPYFAVIQARLSRALCNTHDASAGSNQIVFKLWITAFGTITHVEMVTGSDDPAYNRTIVAGIEGLNLGKSPPADMPEPVIMAIYPPKAGEAPGCSGE